MALIKCPECGKEISDKAPACIHCGYPLNAKPELGTAVEMAAPERDTELEASHQKLEYPAGAQTDDTLREESPVPKKATTSRIVGGSIAIVAAVAVISLIIWFSTSPQFLSDDEKDERIADVYANEGYDAAVSMVYDYYGSSEDATLWIMALQDIEKGISREKLSDQIEIVSQNLTTRSRNYFDYEVTVRNNSDQEVSYIKVNIYLKDADENIIQSDWTNWSGSLPPDASTTLDTMLDYVDGVEFYSVTVAEVH